MRLARSLRLLAVLGLVAGTLTMSAPAQGQAAVTNIDFRFAGSASVSPGIFLPGLDSGSGPWTFSFVSADGCDAAGVVKGTPVAGVGNCLTTSAGDLLPDLIDQPACGNSRGFSRSASFTVNGIQYTGEVHWDGVVQGSDPSYSLGSQLYLWGEMTGNGETLFVQLLLNASGGSNCVPQISPGGATSFTVNGVGSATTKVV